MAFSHRCATAQKRFSNKPYEHSRKINVEASPPQNNEIGKCVCDPKVRVFSALLFLTSIWTCFLKHTWEPHSQGLPGERLGCLCCIWGQLYFDWVQSSKWWFSLESMAQARGLQDFILQIMTFYCGLVRPRLPETAALGCTELAEERCRTLLRWWLLFCSESLKMGLSRTQCYTLLVKTLCMPTSHHRMYLVGSGCFAHNHLQRQS